MSEEELARAVDEAGAAYERKVRMLEEFAARIFVEDGTEVAINHLPVRIPIDAKFTHVGDWPDGTPQVIATYWSRVED